MAGAAYSALAASPSSVNALARTWAVSRVGPRVQIAYGSGTNFPQYAVLDLRSGYFRMVYSTTSGWGSSVILLPALWSKTSCPTDYCQGTRVTSTWRRSGTDLTLSVHGTIATLKVAVKVTLTPPVGNQFAAHVSTSVAGTVRLDHRPGEAFKPVMLSSMRVSPTQWDTRSAFTGTRIYRLPTSGRIIHPPAFSRDFGLRGGTSSWKKNAPTIEVIVDRRLPVTGWVTQLSPPDPNDDNVGFWCVASRVLSSWSFTVIAEAGRQL